MIGLHDQRPRNGRIGRITKKAIVWSRTSILSYPGTYNDYLYLIKNYNSYQNELNFKQVFEKWLDFTKEKLSIFQKLTNTKNGNREI